VSELINSAIEPSEERAPVARWVKEYNHDRPHNPELKIAARARRSWLSRVALKNEAPTVQI